jgi:hypothetical protein
LTDLNDPLPDCSKLYIIKILGKNKLSNKKGV